MRGREPHVIQVEVYRIGKLKQCTKDALGVSTAQASLVFAHRVWCGWGLCSNGTENPVYVAPFFLVGVPPTF